MTASAAQTGYGTTIAIGNGAIPEVFTALAEVKTIKGLKYKKDQPEVTHLSSPGGFKEFIDGLRDFDAITGTYNYVPGGTAETALLAVYLASSPTNYKITFPNGGSWTFGGLMTEVSPGDIDPDKPMDGGFVIKPSGAAARSSATATVPAAPSVSAAAGNDQVVLTFTDGSDGGSSITSHKLYQATTSGAETLVGTISSGSPYTVTGLTNGTAYYFKVSAVNAIGEGARSTEVTATPSASATVPAAPSLSAAAGNDQVVLTFTDGSDGGSSITSHKLYQATTSGAETLVGTISSGSPYTVTGLTNGTAYYFKVSAVNAIGEGARSTEVTATPSAGATVPAAPTVTAAAGNAQVVLTFTDGSNGGAAITSHKLYDSTTSGSEVLIGTISTGSPYTVTGLTNGTPYYFKLSAVNSVGEGALSTEVTATPVSSAANLPTVASAPSVVLNSKKVVPGYSGHSVNVTVSGTPTDLGWSGQDIDGSIGVGTYPLNKWYDQSGNGKDFINSASGGNQWYLNILAGHPPCITCLENSYLDIPSSLSTDPSNSAVFWTGRQMWQAKPSDIINWGTSDTTSMHFGNATSGSTYGLNITAAGTDYHPSNGDAKFMSTCTPCILAYNSHPSNGLKIRRDGHVSASLGNLTSATLSGGRIGFAGGYTDARQDMFGLVVYPAALSSADELAVATALKTINNTNNWSPSLAIFQNGDSKTEGDSAVTGRNLMRCVHDEYGNVDTVVIRNFGSNGWDIQSHKGTPGWYSESDPGNFLDSDATKNIYVCWLGTNDIASGSTEAQITGWLNDSFDPSIGGTGWTLPAQGWYGTVLGNIMPRHDVSGGAEAIRVSFNANAPTNVHGISGHHHIWDVDALTHSGGVLYGFTTDATLSGDGLHETEKAYILEGPSLKAAIELSRA